MDAFAMASAVLGMAKITASGVFRIPGNPFSKGCFKYALPINLLSEIKQEESWNVLMRRGFKCRDMRD